MNTFYDRNGTTNIASINSPQVQTAPADRRDSSHITKSYNKSFSGLIQRFQVLDALKFKNDGSRANSILYHKIYISNIEPKKN